MHCARTEDARPSVPTAAAVAAGGEGKAGPAWSAGAGSAGNGNGATPDPVPLANDTMRQCNPLGGEDCATGESKCPDAAGADDASNSSPGTCSSRGIDNVLLKRPRSKLSEGTPSLPATLSAGGGGLIATIIIVGERGGDEGADSGWEDAAE